MAKGIALTIGLNSVDPNHYDGWSGILKACEDDARDMADIAKAKGFEVDTLLTRSATRDAAIRGISKATADLKSGDIFILAYSGHGGQVPDINKDEEKDHVDETWCLYDGELIDDEINNLFSNFADGVRILVFSDSCYSGDIVKRAFGLEISSRSSKGVRYKYMPLDKAANTYLKNRTFYDAILKNPNLKASPEAVKASVLLISGCQENQESQDGEVNSLFTATLRQVWNSGVFRGNYKSFHESIVEQMPNDQKPTYLWIGKQNPAFEAQEPFTI
jgi:uncharacterized caspase-like protein